MSFPPLNDAAAAELLDAEPPYVLDPTTVARVYQAAWYLLPGPAPARAATRWTFEVATTRLNQLPPDGLVVPWLVTIADRESRRHRSINQWARRKNQRYPDAHDPAERALHLAEAVGRIDPDQRLALVLHYMLHTPAEASAAALGVRPSHVAAFVQTSEIALARHTNVSARLMGTLPAPDVVDLPGEIMPMGRTDRRRSKLNYGWQSNGFPTKTAYDNVTRRRATYVAATAAGLALVAVGFNQLEPLRPTLEQPASAQDIGEPDSSSIVKPSTTAAPVPSVPASDPAPGDVPSPAPSTSVTPTDPATTAPGLVFPDLSSVALPESGNGGFVFPDLSDVLDAN